MLHHSSCNQVPRSCLACSNGCKNYVEIHFTNVSTGLMLSWWFDYRFVSNVTSQRTRSTYFSIVKLHKHAACASIEWKKIFVAYECLLLWINKTSLCLPVAISISISRRVMTRPRREKFKRDNFLKLCNDPASHRWQCPYIYERVRWQRDNESRRRAAHDKIVFIVKITFAAVSVSQSLALRSSHSTLVALFFVRCVYLLPFYFIAVSVISIQINNHRWHRNRNGSRFSWVHAIPLVSLPFGYSLCAQLNSFHRFSMIFYFESTRPFDIESNAPGKRDDIRETAATT